MSYVAALYNYGGTATTVSTIVGSFDTEPEADRWIDRHPPANIGEPAGIWRVQRLESPYPEPIPSEAVLERVSSKINVALPVLREAFEEDQV